MNDGPLTESYLLEGIEGDPAQRAIDVPVVRILAPVELAARYDDIALKLEDALAASWQLDAQVATVSRALASGNAWVIVVDHGARVMAACVVERIDTVRGEALNIWLLSGNNMVVWLAQLLDVIHEFAASLGIDTVMLCGRRGWDSVLQQYGYRTEAVTMIRRLVL